MKKAVLAVSSILLMAVFGFSSAWAGPLAERQVRQKERIRHVIHSGELTRAETRILLREQSRIQRAKRLAWSDGRLTPHERFRLHRMQDRAGWKICRFKHNHRR